MRFPRHRQELPEPSLCWRAQVTAPSVQSRRCAAVLLADVQAEHSQTVANQASLLWLLLVCTLVQTCRNGSLKETH